VTVAHARGARSGDVATATACSASLEKQNYIAPDGGTPGRMDASIRTGTRSSNPQAPIPGAVPGKPDAQGNMTWNVPAGVEDAVRERAQSQSGGESAGKAPYQFQEVLQPRNRADGACARFRDGRIGGGSLNAIMDAAVRAARKVHQAPQQAGTMPPAHPSARLPQRTPTAPARLRVRSTRRWALKARQSGSGPREMQSLLKGGLQTGPTQARMQELAEAARPVVPRERQRLRVQQGRGSSRRSAGQGAWPELVGCAVRGGGSGHSEHEDVAASAGPGHPRSHRHGICEQAKRPRTRTGPSTARRPIRSSRITGGRITTRACSPPTLRAVHRRLPRHRRSSASNGLSDYRNLKALGVNFGQFAQ
jgi:hypothetical protein